VQLVGCVPSSLQNSHYATHKSDLAWRHCAHQMDRFIYFTVILHGSPSFSRFLDLTFSANGFLSTFLNAVTLAVSAARELRLNAPSCSHILVLSPLCSQLCLEKLLLTFRYNPSCMRFSKSHLPLLNSSFRAVHPSAKPEEYGIAFLDL